jgi:hypothetical protein
VRKLVISLIGLPSSGKTTIGKFLRNSGYELLPEAASIFISKGYEGGERARPEFDRKIMDFEFARDYRFYHSTHSVQIVETWHIGNLAYAMARDSFIVNEYKRAFTQTLNDLETRCLLLELTPKESYDRSLQLKKQTVNSVYFLTKVRDFMISVIDEFGLVVETLDANQEFERASHLALDKIKSWLA